MRKSPEAEQAEVAKCRVNRKAKIRTNGSSLMLWWLITHLRLCSHVCTGLNQSAISHKTSGANALINIFMQDT